MIHPSDCSCDTYGCAIRRKGIQVGPSASPTARWRRPFREKVNCSENAGLAGEGRPGGTFMPYLEPMADGSGRFRPVHTKEGRDRRTEISRIRDRQRKAPALGKGSE